MKNLPYLLAFMLFWLINVPSLSAQSLVQNIDSLQQKLNLNEIEKALNEKEKELARIAARKQKLVVKNMSRSMRSDLRLNMRRRLPNKTQAEAPPPLNFEEDAEEEVVLEIPESEGVLAEAEEVPESADTYPEEVDIFEVDTALIVQEKELALIKEQEQKKMAELAALRKALEVKSLRQQYLIYGGTILFVFFSYIVGTLYRSNIRRKKSNQLLAEEKAKTETERDRSEQLLLNILPASVAEELKTQGKAPVRHYPLASVMFTDFKGFTTFAEQMSPAELVEELDACFAEFDAIITRHHLEKIKTIGDAYMCVGGIPDANTSNPLEMVLAGLEIQQFMIKKRQSYLDAGKDYWRLRLGIHSGELIAGVIGRKKFAYDVWGDTVNTAARMESSGEIERVNISGYTHELVKDFFDCEYRGKIPAKNKGEVDMYFVNRLKVAYSQDDKGLVPNQAFYEALSNYKPIV